jgi:hypothetical protein
MPRATNATTAIGGLLIAFGLVTAGCGLIAVDDPTFANAPLAVRERAPLPGCGAETVRAVADANVDARRCLWSAYQGHRPAEFVTTRWSIEGDPITWIYRILPGGAVEVFIDSTRDAWSAKTWLHLACPGLSLIDEAQVQLDFGPGLGAGGECTETTIR